MWLNINCGCLWRKKEINTCLKRLASIKLLESLLLTEGSRARETTGGGESACSRDKRNLHLHKQLAGEARRRRASGERVPKESDSGRCFRKRACPRHRLIWQQKIASWSFPPSHTEDDSRLCIWKAGKPSVTGNSESCHHLKLEGCARTQMIPGAVLPGSVSSGSISWAVLA